MLLNANQYCAYYAMCQSTPDYISVQTYWPSELLSQPSLIELHVTLRWQKLQWAAACSRCRCANCLTAAYRMPVEPDAQLLCASLRVYLRQSCCCCCWRRKLATSTTTMDEKTYEKVITTTKTYRTTAAASPRSSLVITRTSGKPSTGGASSSTATRSTTTNRGDASSVAFTEGAYTSLTATGVNQVKTTRDQEKKDMQDLNDRFSDYISKVRNRRCSSLQIAIKRDKNKNSVEQFYLFL